MSRPTSPRFLGGSLAIVLAILQFRVIAFLIEANYMRCVEAATGIVEGRPHWRLYQSRVLGPYVLEGLTHVFPSAISAHVFLSIALLSLAGWLAWRMGARIAGLRGAVTALFVLHACFALLLGRRWLYLWDFIDVIVFLAFLELVLTDRPLKWFVGLFAIAILNHEIAMFIGLWLVIDPVARWALGRRGVIPPVAFERTRVLVGILCMAASYLLVEALRNALLVEEIGPKLFLDVATAGKTLNVTLWDNLESMKFMFVRFDYGMPFIIPVFLLAVLGVAATLARRDPRRFTGVALMHLAMVGSLLCFGVLMETRIYVVLIPIVVVACLLLVEPPQPAPEP